MSEDLGGGGGLALSDGEHQTIKTIAHSPPLFVLDDFLSADECRLIIAAARHSGLRQASTHQTGHSGTLLISGE